MRDALAGWLATKLPGASGVELHDLAAPPQGSPNKTVMFRASWTAQGERHERSMTVRLQVDGNPFIEDVFKQWRIMEVIASRSEVAVPRLLFAEPDRHVLGSPFFVMESVDGRAPQDSPSYHAGGWFATDLTPADRGRLWWNGIEEMARLHRIDWSLFPFLYDGDAVPGPAHYVGYLGRWYEWAARGRTFPIIEVALRHLREGPPRTTAAGLVWNDARLGNMLFGQDLTAAAIVDFEAAEVGPAEVDLAWWLFMDDFFSAGQGLARLDGVPSRDATIARYEQLLGRPMVDIGYFDVVAALKLAVISIPPPDMPSTGVDRGGRPSSPHEFATSHLARHLGLAT